VVLNPVTRYCQLVDLYTLARSLCLVYYHTLACFFFPDSSLPMARYLHKVIFITLARYPSMAALCALARFLNLVISASLAF
ncbi:MAG: hypothetical protein WC086_01900, partial [Dehalococcoidales bacterium]